jgi:hypothetical protein
LYTDSHFSRLYSEEPLVSRDPALAGWLREAFGSAPDEDLIYLAAVLPQLARLVDPAQLRAALARENPKVKVAILQSLRAGRVQQGPALARAFLGHADPEVRRAAILAAFDSSADRGELDGLEEVSADPEPRVRAAAAACFAGAVDARARALGRERLEAMVRSEDRELRAAAAEALEQVDDVTASEREIRTRLLRALLGDREVPVVLAALETVKSRRDSALALPVLSLLEQPVLAGPASDALVAMGPPVIDPVHSLVEPPDGRRRPAALASVARVLERIGDPRGLAIIRRMRTPADTEQRTAVFRSYVGLIRRGRAADAHRDEIDRLVLEECRAAAVWLGSLRRLGKGSAVRLARDAASDLVACHVENAFVLLAGRIRDVDMTVLHEQITRGSREARSHALELLENVLPKELRAPLLEVLDPAAEGEDAKPDVEVRELLSRADSEWVVAGAAWAAAELALASCADRLDALKNHESPVVRETALFALARIGGTR